MKCISHPYRFDSKFHFLVSSHQAKNKTPPVATIKLRENSSNHIKKGVNNNHHKHRLSIQPPTPPMQ